MRATYLNTTRTTSFYYDGIFKTYTSELRTQFVLKLLCLCSNVCIPSDISIFLEK